MAESEKLYQEIRNYFLSNNRPQVVIKISSTLPMDQWSLVHVNNPEEMSEIRANLNVLNIDFAGFIVRENKYQFYFLDSNIHKCEDVDTGIIILFRDRKFNNFNLEKVAEELRQLIQGS